LHGIPFRSARLSLSIALGAAEGDFRAFSMIAENLIFLLINQLVKDDLPLYFSAPFRYYENTHLNRSKSTTFQEKI
jgi:hypothetical protein